MKSSADDAHFQDDSLSASGEPSKKLIQKMKDTLEKEKAESIPGKKLPRPHGILRN
jgi:hypothetical protein